MKCQECRVFADAQVDGELDVVTSLQLEGHLDECADCRSFFKEYEQFNRAVQAHMPRFDAPAGLEQKIRSQLRLRKRPQVTSFAGAFAGWRSWAAAASFACLLLLAGISFTSLRGRTGTQIVAEQVVSSHVRSLMANHLSDVASTDQHTVKPWFSGKLDFAPVVKDLSPVGFPLTGGRLDYLDDHSVAALIYKRRKHTINLFLWPSTNSDVAPEALTIRGFNVVHWTERHMSYWAVSDLNASELGEFARDLRNSPS